MANDEQKDRKRRDTGELNTGTPGAKPRITYSPTVSPLEPPPRPAGEDKMSVPPGRWSEPGEARDKTRSPSKAAPSPFSVPVSQVLGKAPAIIGGLTIVIGAVTGIFKWWGEELGLATTEYVIIVVHDHDHDQTKKKNPETGEMEIVPSHPDLRKDVDINTKNLTQLNKLVQETLIDMDLMLEQAAVDFAMEPVNRVTGKRKKGGGAISRGQRARRIYKKMRRWGIPRSISYETAREASIEDDQRQQPPPQMRHPSTSPGR